MSKYEDEWGMTLDSVERLFDVAKLVAEHKDAFHDPVDWFFSQALEPYYSPMSQGGDRTVLDIVYRLSDRLPSKTRSRIMVYPSPTGEIWDKAEDGRMVQWDSLNDFRREWERAAIRSGRSIPAINELGKLPELPLGGPNE